MLMNAARWRVLPGISTTIRCQHRDPLTVVHHASSRLARKSGVAALGAVLFYIRIQPTWMTDGTHVQLWLWTGLGQIRAVGRLSRLISQSDQEDQIRATPGMAPSLLKGIVDRTAVRTPYTGHHAQYEPTGASPLEVRSQNLNTHKKRGPNHART